MDSAFLGFLPVVISHYMDEGLDLDLGASNSIGLFLLSTEILLLTYSGLSAVSLAVLGLIAYYAWRVWSRVDPASLREASNRRGHFELPVASLLLLLGMSFLLFPQDIAAGGRVVNILSHYSGFYLGFFVLYFWFQAEK